MTRTGVEVQDHLDYLSRVARELDTSGPVDRRAAEFVGRHEELREAAEVWRRAADRVETTSDDVQSRLGAIDSAWQGADADAFLEHLRAVGLAGNDLLDTMRGLADALEHTAEAVRLLQEDLVELVAEVADSVSAALLAPDGAQRARKHLVDLVGPAAEQVTALEEVFTVFARFCEELAGGRPVGELAFDDRMPEQNWNFTAPAPAPDTPAPDTPAPDTPAPDTPAPATPAAAGDAASDARGGTGPGGGGGGVGAVGGGAVGGGAGGGGAAPESPPLPPGGTTGSAEPVSPPAAAASAAPGGAGGSGGTTGGYGMMPMGGGMMGGMGGAQGGAQERQNSSRIKANPDELFGGRGDEAAPAVFGEGKRPATVTEADETTAQRTPTAPPGAGAATPDQQNTPATTPGTTTTPPPKPTGTASIDDAPPPRRRRKRT
ncbi:WXG100 family type VII secretion target [Saccharopolyspora cebuensis]|uniref:WXG100 family type VII secretion target n=1 Tax=Saccharopolyspora cebuensis TaxID=418759 RepID=A0ABV4CJR5_9PSEU